MHHEIVVAEEDAASAEECDAPVRPDASGALTIARHQDILVRGNRIAELRPTGGPVEPGVTVLEGQRMLAMPGLINTHAHVPMVLFRGLAEDVPIEPGQLDISANVVVVFELK